MHGQDGATPINQTRWVGGVLFALCDSNIPGKERGPALPRLSGLATRGAEGNGRTRIELPASPTQAPLHMTLVDQIRLTKSEELAAVIDEYPRVVAILCGHAHTAAASRCLPEAAAWSRPGSSRPRDCRGPQQKS